MTLEQFKGLFELAIGSIHTDILNWVLQQPKPMDQHVATYEHDRVSVDTCVKEIESSVKKE